MTPSTQRTLLFLCLLAIVVALGVFVMAGCGTLSWFQATPAPPPVDPLASPFGYLFAILRTVVQWALIGGLLMLIPAVRAVCWPVLCMLFRAPATLFSKTQRKAARRDARKAAVGACMVTGSPRANYARLQQLGIDEGWVDEKSGALKAER
jgi:hypothetical protein